MLLPLACLVVLGACTDSRVVRKAPTNNISPTGNRVAPKLVALGRGPCRGSTAQLTLEKRAVPVSRNLSLQAHVGDAVTVHTLKGCQSIFMLSEKLRGEALVRRGSGWEFTRAGRVDVPVNYAMCSNIRRSDVPCVGGLTTLTTVSFSVTS